MGEMRRGFASLGTRRYDESRPATGGNSCRDPVNRLADHTEQRIGLRFRQEGAPGRGILLRGSCLSVGREMRFLRGTIVKAFLNVFRQFSEVNFRDSRFALKYDAVSFHTADRYVVVLFAVNCFEVIGETQ